MGYRMVKFIIILKFFFILNIISNTMYAKAENYLPRYNCDNTVIYTTNCPEVRKDYNHYGFIFSKSTYRCGNTKGFIDV